MTDTNVIDITSPSGRDQRVLSLRLAGVSTLRIAGELGLGAKDVIAALEVGK